jgi:hypothetical protein
LIVDKGLADTNVIKEVGLKVDEEVETAGDSGEVGVPGSRNYVLGRTWKINGDHPHEAGPGMDPVFQRHVRFLFSVEAGRGHSEDTVFYCQGMV